MGIFYPYQKQWVKNKSRLQIHNTSRQIGKSDVGIAYKSVDEAYFGNTNVMICSSSQRQSNQTMSYVEKYIKILKDYYGIKLSRDTQTQKTFSNGKSIFCFPSKPETVRGFPGNVKLDEFALHKEADKIYTALLPSISSRSHYTLEIFSTPLGTTNKFHDIFSNTKDFPDFQRDQINIYEAIKQGCKMDVEFIKRNVDEESFEQEYLCQFLDSVGSYFPYELTIRCVDETETIPRGNKYMGIDIGRTRDLTAIAVSVENCENWYCKRMDTMKNVDFDMQMQVISQIIKEENPNYIYVDKGAIGMQLAETINKKFGNSEGVMFSAQFKSELATNMKMLMEQGRFKMSFGDETKLRNVINAFHKIKKHVTLSNNISFDSERDGKGHADEFWAVALSCKQKPATAMITRI